jgi:hypothetical protein
MNSTWEQIIKHPINVEYRHTICPYKNQGVILKMQFEKIFGKEMAMNRVKALLIIEAFALMFLVLLAGRSSREAYYGACIDARIAQCAIGAGRSGLNSDDPIAPEAESLEEIRFYQDYKEELVEQMLEEGNVLREQEVMEFLVKAHQDFLKNSAYFLSE